MKEKMRILVVEPVKRPYVKEIDHTLEEMQKVVGGSIQALYPFEDRVGLICNDEAKIAGGFTPNRALRDENGNVYDIIFVKEINACRNIFIFLFRCNNI